MGSSPDFDLTRGDTEEQSRRSSVLQLRRAQPTPPPVIDEGDDWDTHNAGSLAIPTASPPATSTPAELPADRAEAFNLERPAPTEPARLAEPTRGADDRLQGRDPGREARPADLDRISREPKQTSPPPPLRRTQGNRSRAFIALAGGAALSTGSQLFALARARKRVLILGCVAMILALAATKVYDAFSADGSDPASSGPKASASAITHSTTIDHSTTRNSTFRAHTTSRGRDARQPAGRTHSLALRHQARKTTRDRTTTHHSTTSPVVSAAHAYTTPTPVVPTPAASSSTADRPSTTSPASSSTTTNKAPAFGASGALGPGSSPDG